MFFSNKCARLMERQKFTKIFKDRKGVETFLLIRRKKIYFIMLSLSSIPAVNLELIYSDSESVREIGCKQKQTFIFITKAEKNVICMTRKMYTVLE